MCGWSLKYQKLNCYKFQVVEVPTRAELLKDLFQRMLTPVDELEVLVLVDNKTDSLSR